MGEINFFNIAPIIVSILTAIIAIVFVKKDAEGEENVDKTFLQNYFRLPYRRRMIANSIGYPVIILIFFIFLFLQI